MSNQAKRQAPYPLRMEDDVKQLLTDRAKANDRSMNAEINRILREVLTSAAKQAA
ncbi:FitA-like ribbon-helix-helix domain-containing protein [Thiothrix lacustris]|uniref:FitA-like ribbon-helix-helix domain-containing protein n=1 Tax=Thiothrix lacustris TaxID=525917 RepID=UPI0009FF9185|nr:Arc family DNA-binding protein [Thiothrix lacustris]